MSLSALQGQECESAKIEKLPTLRQFLKLKGKQKLPNRFTVFLIWLPGKFPNYTLQTEAFRFQIVKDSPLFPILKSAIDEMMDEEKTIALEITDRETAKVKIHASNEKGAWESLGETGLKFNQG